MAALGTRLLKLEVGGTEYTAEVSRVAIVAGESDSDFITFADAAAGGGREYTLEFTAVQDLAADTLWDHVWTEAGTEIDFEIIPYGNTAASAAQPHITGSATITEPDGDFIGGEADPSTSSRFTFDCAWVCTEKPLRVAA